MTDRQRYKSLYWCWKAMKQRTLNPNCSAWKNYGGRGIGICNEWLTFEPFLQWALSSGWAPGLDIDRIDNDGDYTPENCRWATRRENTNNRRATVFITVGSETHPASVWAELTGIPISSLNTWCLCKGRAYAEKKISEALASGYVHNNYGYNHTKKPVIHVESGVKFNSMWDAAKHFGLNRGALSQAVKLGCRTRVGHFKLAGIQ